MREERDTHNLDRIGISVARAVDKVNPFSSSAYQLDRLADVDRGGNGVRSRKLTQRDDTEREVLRDKRSRNRGGREKRGEGDESVEDHVGQWITLCGEQAR